MRRMKLAQLGFIFTVCLTFSQLINPGYAEEGLATDQPPPVTAPAAMAMANAVDFKKLALAEELTDWLQNTLQQKKALVAVVARKGGKDIKKHDKTGMAHTGLAIYDPRAQTWLIYNLVQDKKPKGSTASATESIWRTAPLDFYYGQTGDEKEALILIPDVETQQRIYAAMATGRYKQFSAITTYNLLSPYDNQLSFNCNKWILFNLAAARIGNYDLVTVAQAVHSGFAPAQVHLSPIEEILVRHKASVQMDELPAHFPLNVVTVESLYRSDLFMEKIFYSGKKEL